MEFSVYVKVDDSGRIIGINSSMFLGDTAGWVEIARGVGDAFQHAQGNFLPGPLMDGRGVFRFKLKEGKVVERAEDEMQTDVKPPEKTTFEKRIEKLETTVNTVTELIAKLGMK